MKKQKAYYIEVVRDLSIQNGNDFGNETELALLLTKEKRRVLTKH
jgi:hypothetical protein